MYAYADGFAVAQKAAIVKSSKTSKGLMGQTVFYPGLNDFCRTYLVTNRIVTPAELVQYPVRLKEENASIFEQLMLFDKISFKVYGENILVPFLISQLGQDAFESLLEQEAIGFTLWTPVVTHFVQDIPGVVALQSGTQSSPAHSDPEMSIELGLKWMSKDQLFPGARRRLIRKLVPLYNVPSPNLSRDAVGMTVSAFNSGKLDALNFSSSGKDIQNLTLPERKDLCRCATELLEYTFLLQHEMTSFSNKQYFSLFDESASKVQTQTKIPAVFNRLARLEGFPDLRALYGELNDPFKRLPQLRAKRSSAAFRKWLTETSSSGKDVDVTKEYVDAIAESKGFFETKKGKLTKSVVMTAIGTGIGALIGGAEGAVGGAAVGKTLEVGADWALDLIDEFLISGLTKGWSPRMFFDDLGRLRER
jgi:hypothetical protein